MRKSLKYVGVALVMAMLVSSLPAVAKDKQEIIESYRANAIMQTGGGSSVLEIHIYRWSSDDERGEILDAIKKSTADPKMNSREVAKALRGQKKAGYAFLAGKQGYPIRYARSFDMEDGSRQIVVATDRPVSFGEVYQQTQLGDFDVTLAVLKLDKDGNGSGILSLGTEMKWNESTGKLVYALRLEGNTVRPWVFAEGTYTVQIGDPDVDKWREFKGQRMR